MSTPGALHPSSPDTCVQAAWAHGRRPQRVTGGLGQLLAERTSAPADLDRLQASATAHLTRAGVSLAGPLRPLSKDDDPRALAVKGWLGGFQGEGQLGTSEVRLRVGFVDRDGRDASFLMISPLLPEDPLTALRAQRAFEIARATFTLTPEGGAPTAP